MSLEVAAGIERINILANPAATCMANRGRRRRVEAQLGELAESSYRTRLPPSPEAWIETHPDPAVTARKLDDKLGEGAVVLVIGGDGTGHNWTNAVQLYAESRFVRKAACLLLGGGFADDGPLALNSCTALQRPSTILGNGKVAKFHPISWTFTHSGESEQILTNLYGTLGGSAAAAMAINERGRDAGYARKAWISYRAMCETDRFAMQVGNAPEQLFELGLANNRTMAGFENCFPFNLTDPEIFHYQLAAKHILASTVRLRLGQIPGEALDGSLVCTLNDNVYWQGDGETQRLPAGTEVVAERFDSPVLAFSTRLPKA